MPGYFGVLTGAYYPSGFYHYGHPLKQVNCFNDLDHFARAVVEGSVYTDRDFSRHA